MRKFIGLLGLLALPAQMGRADNFDYFVDGSTLWEACLSDQPYAYGIIAGVHDILAQAFAETGDATFQVCLPDEERVPMIKKTICEDLAEYPHLRSMPAAKFVWSSMLVNYRCP